MQIAIMSNADLRSNDIKEGEGDVADLKSIKCSTYRVKDYKDQLKVKAEHLIVKGFPEKIVQLNELLETPNFQNRNLTDVHQELNIPVPEAVPVTTYKRSARKLRAHSSSHSRVGARKVQPALITEPLPCNKVICELIALVKPKIRELVEDSKLLKMWISIMIPKIEDGNNFGVAVQEDTLDQVLLVEGDADAFFAKISHYFISRAKIVSKVAQHPHIDDYRRAVQELDEKQYLELWVNMCEIRNDYCTLHDLVIKNLDKIKKPRSSHGKSLY